MGFRFRKTFSILPGVRVNLSKTGVSTSIGGHGATVNIGKDGPMVTVGAPGTGMSYRVPLAGPILLIVVVAIVAVGLVYLLKPELVHAAFTGGSRAGSKRRAQQARSLIGTNAKRRPS